MKYFTIYVTILYASLVAVAKKSVVIATPSEQDGLKAESNYVPFAEKHQDKRYISYNGASGYGGYGGFEGYGVYGSALDPTQGYYNNPYSSSVLGLEGIATAAVGGASIGYGGYGDYGGYGTSYSGISNYGSPLGYGGYNSNPYTVSHYNNRIGSYPYRRAGYSGFGYNSYPSLYYSSNYGNSIVGGGLGALGVPPIGAGLGYQYGPGISGTIY